MDNKRISKFLSLVLRHKPQALGVSLDAQGWALVEELLFKMQQKGMPVDLLKLQEVVATNDKQRFAFSADGSRIRASQGHSLPVELGLQPLEPPAVLYHGTATQYMTSILQEGLQAKSRQYVHLSADRVTARMVGQRHGKAVLLIIKAASMHNSGYTFFQAANGVWLTAHVPPLFLEIIEEIQ
ncbi:phosphotransferase KptA/Tpt1 [Flammeovirgaceae bacterium 311]|nr:phosphotransferase KptA/Tpt1 [Flammeovirgaceae bacterium 311]